jgi:hypothetical protein
MFMPPPRDAALPGALLDGVCAKNDSERLVKVLQLIHGGLEEVRAM